MRIGCTELVFDCRRQWVLQKFWEPKAPVKVHLWFGTLMHRGLEVYHQSQDQIAALDALFKVYRDLDLGEYEELRPQYEESYEQARTILRNYITFDRESPLGGQVQKTEVSISEVLFHDPDLGDIVLAGRLDLILIDGDRVTIVDHKTAAQKYSLGGLDVDEQLTAYAYLYYFSTGVLPWRVMYNVLIKDSPRPPRVLKDGSLSKDLSQKTVYSLYRQEIQNRGLNPRDYDDVLSSLMEAGWKAYFQREGSTRNLSELQSYRKRAEQKARDLVLMIKDPARYAYPNPSTYRCSNCVFLSVCKSIEDGGDYHSQLEAHFQPRRVE